MNGSGVPAYWTGSLEMLPDRQEAAETYGQQIHFTASLHREFRDGWCGCWSGLGAEPLNGSAPAMPPGPGGLTLTVIGDAEQSYGVTLLFNGQAVVRHDAGGEFSAVFQNEERSVEDRVNNWKATSWAGDATRVTLDGGPVEKSKRDGLCARGL